MNKKLVRNRCKRRVWVCSFVQLSQSQWKDSRLKMAQSKETEQLSPR